MDGVTKLPPLANAEPPVDVEYQSTTSPAPVVAEMLTDPDPHLAAPVGLVGGAGKGLTATDEVVLMQLVVVFVKVNVALPAETPVTTPAFVTVATAVLLLVHVPPDVGDKVIGLQRRR